MSIARYCSGVLLCCLIAAPVFAAPLTSVVEFYNRELDHYFVSIDQKEIDDLDRGVHPG